MRQKTTNFCLFFQLTQIFSTKLKDFIHFQHTVNEPTSQNPKTQEKQLIETYSSTLTPSK
jgi:hypothetical protein